MLRWRTSVNSTSPIETSKRNSDVPHLIIINRKTHRGEISPRVAIIAGSDSQLVDEGDWWEGDRDKEIERFYIFYFQIKGCMLFSLWIGVGG